MSEDITVTTQDALAAAYKLIIDAEKDVADKFETIARDASDKINEIMQVLPITDNHRSSLLQNLLSWKTQINQIASSIQQINSLPLAVPMMPPMMPPMPMMPPQ